MSEKAAKLRDLFRGPTLIRIVGAHDGLGAKLIEKSGFDGVWASGLEISASHGVPDANILTMTENLEAAISMNDATALPVVCDCDTGFGNAANARHMVKRYEAAGLAAAVIEDKLFPKLNSFIAGRQELADINEFMGKIEAAKNAQKNDAFMVFARVEALIAGWGLEEALKRAYAYAEAGADGIVIHSKAKTPDEIFSFASKWKSAIPLVAIPTTYSSVTAEELLRRGFKMAIYANHGLRASIRAVTETLESIRRTGSTAEVEGRIASMQEVFDLQGMADHRRNEELFSGKESPQAVIPAGGNHGFQSGFAEILKDRPLCMLPIGEKTLLERQVETLRSCGVNDIQVVTGHLADKIRVEGANLLHNPDHAQAGTARSILAAESRFHAPCVVVYSDILFDRRVLERLLSSPHDVTLVIDRAYGSLPHRDKKLDLVITEDAAPGAEGRRLSVSEFKIVRQVGRRIDPAKASCEFIGMALFRQKGLDALAGAWRDALGRFRGRAFYEAPSPERADFNDLLQFLIDRGTPVHGLEIEHGWSEIHSMEDYRRLMSHFERALAAQRS